MMRLLKTEPGGVFSLVQRDGSDVPPYAILSHTWGKDEDELTFEDIKPNIDKTKVGFNKLFFCQQQAAKDGLDYFWIDTCCIDKRSSSELTEAINSMFRWYRNAAKCYVYLADVATTTAVFKGNLKRTWEMASMPAEASTPEWMLAFRKSRWFTRGWTLQELIAPKVVEFFSSGGYLLGNRESLVQEIHQITDIATLALQGSPLTQFSIDKRLSWASSRQTKKEEDAAYSLLRIFDVFMSPIYGEGRENAHKRLQRKIMEPSQIDQRLQNILQLLAAPDPSTNYEKALKARQAHTGLWFLESETYQQWTTKPGTIWLHGIPGCGKTILSSTILENILQYTCNDRNKRVAYFYFDFNDQGKQDPLLMIRSLISQLAYQSKKPSAKLDALHTTLETSQRQLSLSTLLQMLHHLVQDSIHTYIILDALDESTDREQLLEAIQNVMIWRMEGVHMLLTSRRERDIEESLLTTVCPVNIVNIRGDVVNQDIETFVRHRLLEDEKLSKWRTDETILLDVESTLVKKADGMFRWVACHLACLRNCRTERKLYEALRTLPPTLDATYERILCAIDEEDVEYAIKILRWLSFSPRPMTLSEVAELVAIDLNRKPAFDQKEVLKNPRDVFDICTSLVSFEGEDANNPTGDRSEVSLAHYSVKEYLISKRICNTKAARFAMEPKPCHQIIARCCIHYLQQPCTATCLYDDAFNTSTLLSYAAKQWIRHAQAAQCETKTLSADVCELLRSSKDNWLGWYWMKHPVPDVPWVSQHPCSFLYYAAGAGFTTVVSQLLDEGADLNAQGDQKFGNALQVAFSRGHEGTVKLLLDKGAYFNTRNSGQFSTTLQEACSLGYTRMMGLFIDEKPQTNGADIHYYGPAFVTASMYGQDHIIKALLDNVPKAITHDYYHGALVVASCRSIQQTTKLLLDEATKLNVPSISCYSALREASHRGHEQVVKLLLDKVDDSKEDVIEDCYSEALSVGILSGHKKIVQLLLSRYANVSTRGFNYVEFLCLASQHNHERIVGLLLDHGGSDLARSKSCVVAFHLASQRDHTEVMRLLLSRGIGNCLQEASAREYMDIVQYLLDQGVDVNVSGGRYHDALQAASWSGNREIVELLLDKGADINAKGGKYGSPLQAALSRGHEQIVQLLRDRGATM